jgi:hypothetical protein
MPSKKRKNQRGAQSGRQAAAANQAAAAPQDEAAAAARREEQRRIWAERKRAKERKPLPVALYAWLAAGAAGIVGVIVLVMLLIGGGGGDDSSPAATFVPDPRVGSLPVDQTEEIIADDQGQSVNPTFSKTTIIGRVGEVIEIRLRNDGTVAHNLSIAGEDGEYGSDDDWTTQPGSVDPGETGILRVKLDDPGSYPFQCDFHPVQQRGELILS